MNYILLSIIFLLVFIIVLLFARMILRSFQNRQNVHEADPSQLGLTYEEISIPAKNNSRLYGWLMRKDPGYPTVILVHGWGRNVQRMLPYVRHLSGYDYNLLAFDARHHGSSSNDDYATMIKFAEDISSAADFIRNDKWFRNDGIGVIGLSIGGAASIYASSMDSRIRSVVSVGAFADPEDIMRLQLRQHHIPYLPLGRLIIRLLERRVGFRFHEVAPEKHISQSKARMLIIHGGEDKTIPVSHFYRLVNAADGSLVRSWLIPGKGHSDCHLADGFWAKIAGHLNESLQARTLT